MTAKELFERIRNDNLSGASELLRKAVQGIEQLEGDELRKFIKLLPLAQPSMASLLTLWDRLSRAMDAGKDNEELAKIARNFLESAEQSKRETVEFASKALSKYKKFATISFSSMVFNVLLRIGERQKISVLVPESRPMCEGKLLAQELAKNGIDVVLVADMAAVWLVKTVDCVILGADAITSKWLVNKVGTYALTLAAKHAKIPVFVVASVDKILSKHTEPLFSIPDRDPSELAELKDVKVKNFYFDLTPLEWVVMVMR